MGCGDDSTQRNIRPIEGIVHLQVREAYLSPPGVGEPVVYLFLQSEELFECYNYEILYDWRQNRNHLTINIRGAALDGYVCLDSFGHAKGRLPITQSFGVQVISVVHNDSINTFILEITDTVMTLKSVQQSTAKPDPSVVWRVPRLSMEFTCGTLVADSHMCQTFVDTLYAHLPLQEIVVPDTGYWPYNRTVQGYYYNSPTRVFRYSTEQEFHEAGALLANLTVASLNNYSGLGMTLQNWRNEMYASWLVYTGDPAVHPGWGIQAWGWNSDPAHDSSVTQWPRRDRWERTPTKGWD